MITEFIDEIIEGNTKESFVNEAEFEFGDKYDCYKTSEFKYYKELIAETILKIINK